MSGARSGRYLPGTAPARTGDGLRGVYGRSAKRAPYLPRHGALPWPLATVYAASTGAVSAERGAGAHKTPLGTAPARTGDGLRGVYGRRSLALDGMAQWRRTDALQSVPILATDTGAAGNGDRALHRRHRVGAIRVVCHAPQSESKTRICRTTSRARGALGGPEVIAKGHGQHGPRNSGRGRTTV